MNKRKRDKLAQSSANPMFDNAGAKSRASKTTTPAVVEKETTGSTDAEKNRAKSKPIVRTNSNKPKTELQIAIVELEPADDTGQYNIKNVRFAPEWTLLDYCELRETALKLPLWNEGMGGGDPRAFSQETISRHNPSWASILATYVRTNCYRRLQEQKKKERKALPSPFDADGYPDFVPGQYDGGGVSKDFIPGEQYMNVDEPDSIEEEDVDDEHFSQKKRKKRNHNVQDPKKFLDAFSAKSKTACSRFEDLSDPVQLTLVTGDNSILMENSLDKKYKKVLTKKKSSNNNT